MADSEKTSRPPSKQSKTDDQSDQMLVAVDSTKRKHYSTDTEGETSVLSDVGATCDDPEKDCQSYTFLDEKTIQNLIEKAVNAAVTQLRTDLTALLHQKIEPVISKMAALECENHTLKTDINVLHAEIADVRSLLQRQRSDLNDIQQYSRKSHVRVFGMPEEQNENCQVKVTDLINSKLNYSIDDNTVEVAHRVGKVGEKPRAILVRFHRRDIKYSVMKARKMLRGSGISISEDLTKTNLNLVKESKQHPRIEDAWGWNGKVFAKGLNGKTFVIRLNESIDDLLEIHNKGD